MHFEGGFAHSLQLTQSANRAASDLLKFILRLVLIGILLFEVNEAVLVWANVLLD